ncbi:MAG: PIN domain nuclease [Caldilineaceae bacterium]|nr:PIN domain nuclease [Caldilineaceae bacterium]
MRFESLLRVLGTLVYGFIGWELGIALARTEQLTAESARYILPVTLVGGALGYLLAPWIVIAPAKAARDSLRTVPMADLVAGTIGMAAGLLIAALISFPISQLPPPFGSILPLIFVIIMGYLGTTTAVLRQDDLLGILTPNAQARGQTHAWMREVIRPVNGSGNSSSDLAYQSDNQPVAPQQLLLDTSVIIDGRIADIAETGFVPGELVVPRFVLNELQYIADSSDALRRNRGRRGLEILDRLQQNDAIAIQFIDQDPQDAQQVDDKLVSLALLSGAAILTNDYNLNRVASLQGVKVLNINELANAVKAVLLPGEDLPLHIIQEGKEAGQGVGFLEDGTMVVVENGRRYLNQEVLVQVTKVLQTNAGRLIFATPE